MGIWLGRIVVHVELDREDTDATAYAWESSTGNSEVEFDNPVSTLDEGQLVELLKACRIARKLYKAADLIEIK
jgi:hypothetical protein